MNQIVKKAPADLMSLLTGDDMKQRLVKLLTDPRMLDRFIGVMTGALKSTPKLAECSHASIVGAMLKCATLRLEPNTVSGQCWLIPRKISGVMECSWELGYKGAIDLGYRSAEIGVIKAKAVYERDLFDIDYGKIQDGVYHKPHILGDRGKLIGYWAQWIHKDGRSSDVLFMSQWEMDQHTEQYVKSMSSEYSPWNTSYEKMALKTVIKQVLKYAPLSVDDLRQADADDGAIIYDSKTKQFSSQSVSTADMLRAERSVPEPEYSEPEPAKEPEPANAPSKAEPYTDDMLRQQMLDKVRDKIKAKGWDMSETVVKLGMPMSMVEKADIKELTRIYGVLK
jgi:recombination protein RecT